jgi:putative peptidoglycan lipid II flippase
MAAFIISQVVGLVRQILITRVFGTGSQIDAYYVAERLPNLIFTLIAGGALASAFVPTFTQFVAKEDRPNAWKLASAVFNLICLLLAAFSLLAYLLAPQIVRYILASHFPLDQQALTVSLLRIMLLTPLIFGASGLLMGILNVYQVFLWPALASTMYWLGLIFGVVVLAPRWGVHGLAWGTVIGACLHLGIQLPSLLKLKGKYSPVLGLDFPAVREVARLMGPRLLGVGAVQLNQTINTILAAGQPPGSVSALAYAWMIVSAPQIVIAQAIATAAMPTFSAQVARGELASMRSSLAATLRGVILLSLPASLGLILLSQPLVALLFQYGQFDAHSTDLVAWALIWYAAGLVGHSVVEILSRAFYSLHDTKTPVLIGMAAMGLNILFSLAFSALFSRLGWAPHGGLALANSLATALEMTGLLILIRRRLNGLGGRQVLAGVAQAGAATFLMGLVVWGWLSWAASTSPLVMIAGGVLLGGIAFLAAALALGAPEARLALKTVWSRSRLALTRFVG